MLQKLLLPFDHIRDSRWMRVFFHLFIFILAMMFPSFFSAIPTDVQPTLLENAQWKGALSTLYWFAFIILCRGLIYDRSSLVMGIIAGTIWLFFGDAAAMPFWAAITTLVFHFCRSRHSLMNVHGWYLFVGVLMFMAYQKLFVFNVPPLFLILYGLMFVSLFLIKKYAQYIEVRNQQRLKIKQAQVKFEEQREQEVKSALSRQISRLEGIGHLPVALKKELNVITNTARLIELCMQRDERDEQPGRLFLERYLPMVETIVTKGLSLSNQLKEDQQQQSLNEQLEALRTLGLAFQEKHQELLINDQTDLKTELSTLDKMLKTDGYRK
ncbi:MULTISPECIES: hypothetical protein [Enterobacteriaceae]|uniref:hypothetical protein n=1 Tax=Enterobacteriaceae TaxID=543 RepID=UPI00034EF4F6|nr:MULTISPECIES: hypothetical protein [Enterobacteriaceae]AGN86047.1 hypothetical protein H650_13225 [Enterobacter sp. R4-368]MCZ3384293.1 hypothetical protein [Kosakonia sp. SOY2]